MRVLQRWNELSADLYCVKMGYGLSLKSALIRTYAENLDTLFPSEVDNFLYSSHPTLQRRLDTITESLKKNEEYMQASEKNIEELKVWKLDISVDQEEEAEKLVDDEHPDTA